MVIALIYPANKFIHGNNSLVFNTGTYYNENHIKNCAVVAFDGFNLWVRMINFIALVSINAILQIMVQV